MEEIGCRTLAKERFGMSGRGSSSVEGAAMGRSGKRENGSDQVRISSQDERIPRIQNLYANIENIFIPL